MVFYLYDDKIVIGFNYKEGTKTITFDDVQKALSEEENGSDLDCLGAPKTESMAFGLFFYFSIAPFIVPFEKPIHPLLPARILFQHLYIWIAMPTCKRAFIVIKWL